MANLYNDPKNSIKWALKKDPKLPGFLETRLVEVVNHKSHCKASLAI